MKKSLYLSRTCEVHYKNISVQICYMEAIYIVLYINAKWSDLASSD